MGKFCECSQGGKNLGQANCDAVLASWHKNLFKQRLDADGTPASIDFSGATGTFNPLFWGNLTGANPMQNRYLVSKPIDDFEFEMQERENVETANGVQYTVRDGNIHVMYHIFVASTELYQRYKALECGNWGIMIVDDNGRLAGDLDESNQSMSLIPINSVSVRYANTANSGTVSHLIVEFRIPHTFDWGSVRLFQPNIAAGDMDLMDLMPTVPLGANTIVATDASDEVTINITENASQFLSGAPTSGIPFTGLVNTNFTVLRNGSPVVVSSVTQTTFGTYELTLATANASNDVLVISASVQGFELAPVTVVVP
jgi:hypothetical protein